MITFADFIQLLPYLILGLVFVIDLVLISTAGKREQEKKCSRKP